MDKEGAWWYVGFDPNFYFDYIIPSLCARYIFKMELRTGVVYIRLEPLSSGDPMLEASGVDTHDALEKLMFCLHDIIKV